MSGVRSRRHPARSGTRTSSSKCSSGSIRSHQPPIVPKRCWNGPRWRRRRLDACACGVAGRGEVYSTPVDDLRDAMVRHLQEIFVGGPLVWALPNGHGSEDSMWVHDDDDGIVRMEEQSQRPCRWLTGRTRIVPSRAPRVRGSRRCGCFLRIRGAYGYRDIECDAVKQMRRALPRRKSRR